MNYQHKLFQLIVFMFFLMAVLSPNLMAAQGKIVGVVEDKSTNEPLIGANIIVQGTQLGAATDADGYYFILNVPPGNYTLEISMIGFSRVQIENVFIARDRTTEINAEMQPEAVKGETVVIEATRPVVQLDVSSSQKIVTSESIAERPMENLEEILATEVGIELSANQDGSGLLIRGGGLNETNIVVDGLSTRNERNQQPVTNISLTAIQEVEILTGGFNAEYGDVRSGLVNVSTREGSLNRFAFNFDYRISPAARKHFGPSPFDLNGPFWQVYNGPDAFTGITQEMVNTGRYPFTFEGWNEVARSLLADPDPANDMTPQALLELWKWQHRSREYAQKPDHILDLTFSGPIPKTGVSFLVSQRYEDLQLVYPFSKDNSTTSNTILKLTSYINPKMKISWNNTLFILNGVSGSIFDDTNGMITGSREGVAYGRDVISDLEYKKMWADANYNPIKTSQYRTGLSLNHVISPKTFYDVRLEFTNYKTTQEPIALRDTTGIQAIGGRYFDEAPWGYKGSALGSITEEFDVVGEFFMSGGGRGQDHSSYWGLRFVGDLVSQINKHNQVKVGLIIDYNKFKERREINHGATTTPRNELPGGWWYWDESPYKLSAYIQDKLEYEGMIANIGLRADYLQPGINPYNLDPDFIFANKPYTQPNWVANGNGFDAYRLSNTKYKLYLLPRLGISHPMTTTSKIFFNYGHFRQPPVNNYLFIEQPSGATSSLGRANLEWPRTIAYEIGIEQRIARNWLFHLMGYYKDVENQIAEQNIVPIDGVSEVLTINNTNYADIRGLELRIEKRVGRWWYGFATLEYRVQSTGLTGFENIYEDPQLADQQANNARQTRDDPVPIVKSNFTFQSPREYGTWLGDWRANFQFDWADGGTELLNPDAPLAEQHRVDVINYYNIDMMLEKRFTVARKRFGIYMMVRNLTNFKGFVNPFNYTRYVDSLKFPHEQGDQKGNDKLGDYDKDHIDIGWNTWSHFVNPRDVFFGLRIQL